MAESLGLTQEFVLASLAALLPMMTGIWLGEVVGHLASQRTFERLTLVALIFIAMMADGLSEVWPEPPLSIGQTPGRLLFTARVAAIIADFTGSASQRFRPEVANTRPHRLTRSGGSCDLNIIYDFGSGSYVGHRNNPG